jgi:hypothetical protein
MPLQDCDSPVLAKIILVRPLRFDYPVAVEDQGLPGGKFRFRDFA